MRQSAIKQRIEVIPNGVIPEVFQGLNGQAVRRRYGLEDMTVLGFVGYIREWHGLDRVIELLAKPGMSGNCLMVIGDGPARKSLEQQANDLGIAARVCFTGSVGRDDLPQFIAAFDVALQPQVTAYASPLKLFEYMAAARAIIAPRVPNITEILDDGCDALLYDPTDPDGLRSAIERLVVSPELRERLGDLRGRKNFAAGINLGRKC